MPNLGGPTQPKRRLFATVADSVVLYASPAWCDVLSIEKWNNLCISAQRLIAIRIIRASRTVSATAALTLADTIPWKLIAMERSEVHRFDRRNQGDTQLRKTLKKRLRRDTLNTWNSKWQSDTGGN